jgi:hypothetical protein
MTPRSDSAAAVPPQGGLPEPPFTVAVGQDVRSWIGAGEDNKGFVDFNEGQWDLVALIIGISVLLGLVVLVAMVVVRGRTGEPPADGQPEVEVGPPPPAEPSRPVPGSRPYRRERGSRWPDLDFWITILRGGWTNRSTISSTSRAQPPFSGCPSTEFRWWSTMGCSRGRKAEMDLASSAQSCSRPEN